MSARELEVTVCWLAEKPLRAGDRVALKHATATVRATVQSLERRLDPETLIEQVGPSELALNDIGTVTLRASSVVVADPYAQNRDTGALILITAQGREVIPAAASELTKAAISPSVDSTSSGRAAGATP